VAAAPARSQTSPLKWPQRRRWQTLVGSALLLVIVTLATRYYMHRREASRLTDQDTLVLADFTNSTGDTIFDTLKPALVTALRQSPVLNILPERRVRGTLRLMTRPTDTPLTPEIAREICQRSNSKAYITAAIGPLGSEYVLGLKAVNCRDGEILAQRQTTAENKEHVLDALGQAAVKLRSDLGESLASVERFDVPLKEATTSSLEALQQYTAGNRAGREKGPPAALPYHLRAVQLDPNFAMAYLNLGSGYSITGEPERAREYYSKAFELRDHASEREKLSIAGMYYYSVTGDLDSAAQTYQKIISNYPREVAAAEYLGLVYAREGQYEKTVESSLRIFPLASNDLDYHEGLSRFYLAAQRLDDARQLLAQAHAKKLDSAPLRSVQYGLAFITKDAHGMEEQLDWLQSKAGGPLAFVLQSDSEAYVGHLRKARLLAQKALDPSIQDDSKEGAAYVWCDIALREADFGNAGQARHAAAEALKLEPTSQMVEVQVALALATIGDRAQVESIEKDLNNRFSLDTQVQKVFLPTIDAQLQLSHKNPSSAIDRLAGAIPMELGSVEIFNNVSCLYPAYVRGKAYLAAGRGKEAAGEFQKILEHTGIVWNCYTGALARLGSARANLLEWQQAREGAAADAARSRTLAAYQDFFELWKTADPDIPVLKQAKAEYVKLQSR
jgi:tetratricopeptide (TPR) repeat protein